MYACTPCTRRLEYEMKHNAQRKVKEAIMADPQVEPGDRCGKHETPGRVKLPI